VVDQGATLLVPLRSDGASQRFVEGAGQKAWTAPNLRASTRDVLVTIQKGAQNDGQLPCIPQALFLAGGVPRPFSDGSITDGPGANSRTELYNHLLVQYLFDDQLRVIAGELIPTIAFGNATAPEPPDQSERHALLDRPGGHLPAAGPRGQARPAVPGGLEPGRPLHAGSVSEASAFGLNGQVSRRLRHFRFKRASSGLNVFLQAGWTPSTTDLIQRSIGADLTLWAPFASRPEESHGPGLSWTVPNSDPAGFGFNGSELILQTCARLHMVGNLFLQPPFPCCPRWACPRSPPPP
jgi:hypothetical protein